MSRFPTQESAVIVLAQDIPLFTRDFPPEEFAQRRTKMYEAIGTHAFALVQGAASPVGYTRFRQSNEFFYLCGIEVPHAYLLLDGARKRTTLFLPHRNEGRERGEGKVLSSEDADLVKQLSGVDVVLGADLLNEQLAGGARTRSMTSVYTPFSPEEGFAVSRELPLRAIADASADPFDGQGSREAHLIEILKHRFPTYDVLDLTPALDNLRLIKSPREIALIKRATRLSGLALVEGMRSTKPGIMEYELDGMAKYVYYRNGAQGEAYFSLIASGPNAWFPHYNAGKRQMNDGEFLLFDFAPDVGYYMSDLTRMMPVNGRFNEWQRELYGFYLGCYKSILQHIRPGVTAAVVKQEAVKDMELLLTKSKFSKPAYEAAAKEFVSSYKASAANSNSSLGHWVGMATHDDGVDAGPLRAGMVFTIEPALRVPEEKIYIRMEDLIVITEKGKEIFSDFVPMEMDEIEHVMKEEGMLQKYPKDENK